VNPAYLAGEPGHLELHSRHRIGTASGFALDVVRARFFFIPDVPRELMTAGVQWLWRAVAILSASGGAALAALVPALSAPFAIPLLDKWPNETDWVGIVLISAGVYLTSGGPLPGWNLRITVTVHKTLPPAMTPRG
jgi:drug/metabolite transporter (DMT)-like permease